MNESFLMLKEMFLKLVAFSQTTDFLFYSAVTFFVLMLFAFIEDGNRRFINSEGIEVRANGTPTDKELYKKLNIGGTPMHWTEHKKIVDDNKPAIYKSINKVVDDTMVKIEKSFDNLITVKR